MNDLTKKYLKENTEVDKLNDRYEYMAEEAGVTLSMCDKLLPMIDPERNSADYRKAVKIIKEIDKGFDKALMSLRDYLKFVDKKGK